MIGAHRGVEPGKALRPGRKRSAPARAAAHTAGPPSFGRSPRRRSRPAANASKQAGATTYFSAATLCSRLPPALTGTEPSRSPTRTLAAHHRRRFLVALPSPQRRGGSGRDSLSRARGAPRRTTADRSTPAAPARRVRRRDLDSVARARPSSAARAPARAPPRVPPARGRRALRTPRQRSRRLAPTPARPTAEPSTRDACPPALRFRFPGRPPPRTRPSSVLSARRKSGPKPRPGPGLPPSRIAALNSRTLP